jgi:23S rRNA-/tRNA-specific pseudouridylate synthase
MELDRFWFVTLVFGLSLQSYRMMAFITTPLQQKAFLQPFRYMTSSFIDRNEILNSGFSNDYNSGLGSENVIFFDDDIIVVDKPTCCSTAPGYREPDSLATRIAAVFKIERTDKMIVHRLDYATSGVTVFARNENALIDLHKQFRLKNKIHKKYTAIVNGYLNNFEGEIDLPLGKQKDSPPLCCVDPSGKESRSSWSLVGRHQGKSLVQLRPHTGRLVL